MSNPVALKQHMWKSKPCKFGIDCQLNLSECPGAHFLEEYRVPICLFLNECSKKECSMYHPQMGNAQEYITLMGIDKIIPTYAQWEEKKKRKDFVIQGAKHTISNKELLHSHLLKTRPCLKGIKCKDMKSCGGAHFLEEYRLPICLYMEFCREKECKAFHPNSGKTREQFMKENNIVLPSENQLNFKKNTSPLFDPNPQVISSKMPPTKTNTYLCSFVKEKSKCERPSCSFAHSIEDLVLPVEIKNISLEEKKKLAEKIMKKQISDVYMRPSYLNSTYIEMIKKNTEMINEIGHDEKNESVEGCKEDEKNIEEILDFISQEKAKEDFLLDIEMMEIKKELVYLHTEDFEENKESEDDETEDEDETKVKIDIKNISSLQKWEQSMKQQGKSLWGDLDEE
jgi:hypothetical protein